MTHLYAQQKRSPFVKSTPLAVKHEVTIEGPLDDVEFFVEEMDAIASAGPDDVVIITVNSGGGSPFVAFAINDAINQCQAHVIMKATGQVASAATLIFFNEADEYYCDKDTEFLFHQPSYNLGYSKHSESKAFTDHIDKASNRIYDRYYKGILPDDLIDRIAKGLECFMFGDEVMELLQKASQSDEDSQEEPEQLSYDQLMKLSKKDILEYFGIEKPSEEPLTDEED